VVFLIKHFGSPPTVGRQRSTAGHNFQHMKHGIPSGIGFEPFVVNQEGQKLLYPERQEQKIGEEYPMGIFGKLPQRINRIFVKVGGKEMIEENIRHDAGIPAKTGMKKFIERFYIRMLVSKRIDATMHPDAKSNHFAIILIFVALHVIADEITQFNIVRISR